MSHANRPGPETAAVCGLFCGTCPSYPAHCGGCLSGRVGPGCVECAAGFRACAKRQGVTRCFKCADFPCERLERFRTRHVVNGIGHHARVIDDLRAMARDGVEAWVDDQTAAHTCPDCGRLIPWQERRCPVCHG